MYCPNCGKKNNANNKFCIFCGETLPTQEFLVQSENLINDSSKSLDKTKVSNQENLFVSTTPREEKNKILKETHIQMNSESKVVLGEVKKDYIGDKLEKNTVPSTISSSTHSELLSNQEIQKELHDYQSSSSKTKKLGFILTMCLAVGLGGIGSFYFNQRTNDGFNSISSKDSHSVIMIEPISESSQPSLDTPSSPKMATGKANTLKVGTTQELSGVFNPMYASSAYDQWIVNMVYQSMTAYNAENELYPVIASELPEIAPDGMSVTFKLREDQKFSDGSVLDGDDVKYTFTLMADPEYIGGYNDGSYHFIKGWSEYQYGDGQDVSGIEVSEDKLTVKFTFAEPDISAAETIGSVAIMPDSQFDYTKGDLDKYKNLDPTEVIGSGAYKLNSYGKSAGASVVLNENYTGEGTYNIQSVLVRTIADGTEVANLQSGDIDYISDEIQPDIIGPGSLIDTVETNHYFRAAEGYFGFNCQSEPTNDKLVRQALSYATPRAEFVDAYYQWPEKDSKPQVATEIEDVSVGYVPTTFWNPISSSLGEVVTGDEILAGLQTYEYDLEKAATLLDEAGWKMGSNNIREKDGKQLQIKFLATQGNSILEMLIPMLKASWNKIGIDLVQNTVDFNTMTMTIDPSNEDASSDWNVFFMALSFTGLGNTGMNLALGYTGTLENPVPGPNNYPQLYNEELNNLLKAGKATGEEAVSVENYKKAMILASEEASFLPIYGNNLFNLYNQRVKNLNTGSVCNWSQALEGAYLEE